MNSAFKKSKILTLLIFYSLIKISSKTNFGLDIFVWQKHNSDVRIAH